MLRIAPLVAGLAIALAFNTLGILLPSLLPETLVVAVSAIAIAVLGLGAIAWFLHRFDKK